MDKGSKVEVQRNPKFQEQNFQKSSQELALVDSASNSVLHQQNTSDTDTPEAIGSKCQTG